MIEKFTNKWLSEETLLSNYNKLTSILNKFPEDRKLKLQKLLDDFEDRYITCPAAIKNYYHGAYPGGLVQHVINVCVNYNDLYKLYKSKGANMNGYTYESGLFCAFVHDLGKLGTLEQPYFIPVESTWHMENQGKLYEHNPKLDFMPHEHRTLWLLQQYGIEVTQIEWISILTHAGMFDDTNKRYWSPFNQHELFKTNLPYILHEADLMSSRLELESEKINKPNKI